MHESVVHWGGSKCELWSHDLNLQKRPACVMKLVKKGTQGEGEKTREADCVVGTKRTFFHGYKKRRGT